MLVWSGHLLKTQRLTMLQAVAAQYISASDCRTCSHLFASTSSVSATISSPSPVTLHNRTPVSCQAVRQFRDKRRSTQQFFDDDDDWSVPADQPVVPQSKAESKPKRAAAAAQPAVVDQFAQLTVPDVSTQLSHVCVKTAEFIKSSKTLDQCPPQRYPEFAVIGRSNVGKSSIINMLTGRKSLALVSKTPGKTVCINHFLINHSWYLVDLPGYGYARRSKTDRAEWSTFTRQYFLERDSLANVLLLVDSSIPPQELDLTSADWLGDSEVPYTLVFTKYDKRKKRTSSPDENITAFMDELSKKWETLPPTLITSASTGLGKVELLKHIAQLREFFKFTVSGE